MPAHLKAVLVLSIFLLPYHICVIYSVPAKLRAVGRGGSLKKPWRLYSSRNKSSRKCRVSSRCGKRHQEGIRSHVPRITSRYLYLRIVSNIIVDIFEDLIREISVTGLRFVIYERDVLVPLMIKSTRENCVTQTIGL